MTYSSRLNQTLLDIAIMATGTLENVFAIAAANNSAVTGYIPPGTALMLPANLAIDAVTQTYLASKGIVIATLNEDVASDSGPFTPVFADEFDA